MKIFNNHDRKNLPRQINYLQFPVIIRSFDHPNNERKKLRLTKLQNMESHYYLEHLKSLNNKKFTRKIEQITYIFECHAFHVHDFLQLSIRKL